MPDYAKIESKIEDIIHKFIRSKVEREDYREVYDLLGVTKVTFTMLFEKDPMSRAMGPEFVVEADKTDDGSIVLYDKGAEPGEVLEFSFPRQEADDIKCKWYLSNKTKPADIDKDKYVGFAEKLYLMQSISNMRKMLDFARNHDPQSGIPNGVGIRKLFREAIETNPDTKYAVIYVNLQNFKYINERIGAKGGDEAIVQYARRLTLCVDVDEGVCRLGGDNFVLFVKPENLDKIIHRLSQFNIDNLSEAPDKTFTLSAWLGIAVGDENEDFGTRIEHASIANMFAKQRLKQAVVYYSDQFKDMLNHNKRIASLFMPALAKHEFMSYFQAKVDMETGELAGFETLCRWRHDGEFIFPDQFIPVIDRLGLTYELDMEILRLTCESIRKWLDMGLNPPILSVNFSRKDIFVPEVEEEIKKVVDHYGISTEYVEIEITETATESEYARIIDFTKNLKNMGFRIAIDDFGTGYSSLSLIHNINADVIKIDKSFVTAIQKDTKTEVLVESIINIAKRLGMDLVAEGVETADEGKTLMNLGCNIAQGFYYSRPSDFDTTTKLLEERPFKPIAMGDG
ncbi:MAG: bifunctional diguanylate cyclase/phosphodiesterase [Lachnospiraceae bacterium]|nr:bifunctional diguanylate cyclase/phosphodiesterase [Lachnospiraceae bacterium]